MNIKALLIFCCLFCSDAYSYVFSIDNNGKEIYWNKNLSQLNFYLHSYTNSNLNSSSVKAITNLSLSSWNEHNSIQLNLYDTTNPRSNNRNDIFFSNSDLYFSGEAIVGLTTVAYDEETGEIVETDIVLNSSFPLSTNNSDEYYIGDVLSHELGHALGLGHSEVLYSTMFFKLTNGQDTLSSDDISGVSTKYLNQNSGIISGKVVGKDSDVGIFGSHVQAISLKTGDVKAAALSDTSGNFKIGGLDTDDEYYLYTSPLSMKGVMPAYYFASDSNFCLENKNYVGSFFQTCLTRDEGYPKAISFNGSSSVQSGNISIRCSLDSPPRYLISKGGGSFDLNMFENSVSEDSVGNAFVGFFSLTEVLNKQFDNIKIDLSEFDVPTKNFLEDYFLEIKITAQPFYSKIYTETEVKFSDYSEKTYPSSINFDSDGNLKLDYKMLFSLEEGRNSANVYDLTIRPSTIEDITLFGIDRDNDGVQDSVKGFASINGLEVDKIFPEYENIQEDRFFYLMTAYIVKKDSSGNYTKFRSRKYRDYDNSECVDAPNSVQLNSLSEKTYKDVEDSLRTGDEEGLACGSVNLDGGKGGGGNAAELLLGFLLILVGFPKRLFKNLYVLFASNMLG